MLNELDAAFAEAGGDEDVRVIVLSGAGPHFSSGHDVKEIAAQAGKETPYERYTRMSRIYIDGHLRWRNVPKPTGGDGARLLHLRWLDGRLNNGRDLRRR